MRTVVITTSEHKQSILSTNFYVQIITQIGGGILFFTVFVHMIPEIRENYENYVKSNESIFADYFGQKVDMRDLSLPYLELAVCFGFFAVYLGEVLMHSLLDSHHSDDRIKEEVYDFDKKSDISTVESESSGRTTLKENEPVLIAIRCHKCEFFTYLKISNN